MNYTEADVERDNGTLTEHIDGTRMGVMTARASLSRLKAAALEGAKVPGLEAQVKELMDAAAPGLDLTPMMVAAHARSERAERQSEVSALQDRVAELEQRDRNWRTHAETVEQERDTAESERDALRAQVAKAQALATAVIRAGGSEEGEALANDIRRALSAPPAETKKDEP